MKETKEEKDITLLINKDEEKEKEEEKEEEEEEDEEIKRISEEMEKEKNEEKERNNIDDEKTGLLRIFRRLKTDFDSEKYSSINQIYESYTNNKDSSKNMIKPNTKRCLLIFMYYVISPIFGIITIIGIFESISMMKIIFEIFKNSIKTYFSSIRKEKSEIIKFSIDDFNNKYNFYYMFFEQVKKESYDFNIMMFFSFIGEATLKATEFRFSIFIFGLITGIGILNIFIFSFLGYDINDNSYSFAKIIFLFIIWLILFFSVGASALLPSQVIIDSNAQYNKYLIKLNEETEKKRDELKEKFEQQKALRIKDIENDEKQKIKTVNEDDKKNDENEELIEKEKNEEDEEDEDNEENEENEDIENNEENKNNKKNKFDSFFMICLITMIGYLLKYFLNLILLDRNEEKNLEKYMNMANCNDTICFEKILLDKNLSKSNSTLFSDLKNEMYSDSNNSFIFIIIIYVSSVALSIGLYSIFDIIFIKNNNEEKTEEKTEEKEEEKKEEKNEENKEEKEEEKTEENKEDKVMEKNKDEEEKKIDGNINDENIKIKETEKKENDENKKENEEVKIEKSITHRVCEIFGCTCYCESIHLNDNKINCCLYKLLLCFWTLLTLVRLVFRSLKNYLWKMYCCCQPIDDDELNNSDTKVIFKKDNECFCYCYQTKRFQYWIHEYLTSDVQKEIFPFMIEYFILKLLTIAFEKQFLNLMNKEKSEPHTNNTYVENYTNFFEINNYTNYIDNFSENKSSFIKIGDIYVLLAFIGTFILFFYFTLTFYPVIMGFKDETKYFKKTKLVETMKLSNQILVGTHGILIFDGFYALIFTSLYLSNSENIVFTKNYLYLVPVLMNKFYYFTLIYYCISYSEQKKKFSLISGSTLISVYLLILETITSSIRDSSSLRSLYITQIVFACSFPCLIFVFYFCTFFIYMICKPAKCGFWIITTMCFCSFIFCFGGFYWWYFQVKLEKACMDEEGNLKCDCNKCKCDCNCCKHSSVCLCCFDFLNYFKCFENSCCNCCTCCKCYDCCHCCSCFYCCGDSCSCECC